MKNAVVILSSFLSIGVAAAGPAASAQDFPDEARKQLVEALGGPFLVFRDKALEDLKLSEKQKETLLEKFPEYVQETMRVFEKMQDAKPEEREKIMQEHRRKSHMKLSAALKDVLEPKQEERLAQLQLQQEGPFALLGQHEKFTKLKISDEQRKQFMKVVQELEKKVQPLVKEARAGGNAEEIWPKVKRIRKEQADKIEALLTETQTKQWKELLGKPLELGD